jgi:hypothetical protein
MQSACPFRAKTGSEGHSITSWAPEPNYHRDGWFGALGTNRVPAISEMKREHVERLVQLGSSVTLHALSVITFYAPHHTIWQYPSLDFRQYVFFNVFAGIED